MNWEYALKFVAIGDADPVFRVQSIHPEKPAGVVGRSFFANAYQNS
jgi:hypothetical protein